MMKKERSHLDMGEAQQMSKTVALRGERSVSIIIFKSFHFNLMPIKHAY